MKNKFLILFSLVLVFALLTATIPAHAQTAPGQIVSVNEPISPELRDALELWLQTPPSSAVYYAVTYTQPIGMDNYVSMVGLNIASPDAPWSVTGDEFGNTQVIWLDTLRVFADGTVTRPFSETSSSAAFKLAMPIYQPVLGAGGGSYVRFPWQPSKAVQFGVLGIHNSDFGLEGGKAVDLISGSDMGSGAANDWAYASVSGTVNYICNYGDTVAVRITGGGDSFLYAHLLPNANLELDHSFSAGQKIGQLKHGTFTDECGNALQQDDHWHLHWGFLMSAGKFQAEGCFLTGAGPLAKWMCGNTETRPLGFLYHYGNIGTNPDPGTVGSHTGTGAGGGPSFWDYFLEGTLGFVDYLFDASLPEHNSNISDLADGVLSGVKIVFRISYMLLRGNLNLAPAFTLIVGAITIVMALRLIAFVFIVWRALLQLVPFL